MTSDWRPREDHRWRSQRSPYGAERHTLSDWIKCPVCGTRTRRPDKHRAYEAGTSKWAWCYGPGVHGG